jgi:hypothetical protein
MNKKGILGLIIVIALVVVAYMAFGGKGSTVTNTTGTPDTTNKAPEGTTKDAFAPVTKDNTDTSLIGRLKNASVAATETGNRVALSNGTAKFSEGDVKGTITLGDAAVEVTVGGVKYALTSIAVNPGASGTFKYVVLFEDSNGTFVDKAYALIGDRVNVTGIRADAVSGDQVAVSVSYLDHDKGEPLASAPTVPHTKIFVIEKGMFNEAKTITL